MTQHLTPIDILNLRFRRRLRGYSVSEVDAFTQKVAADLEYVLTEGAALRERIETLEREVAQYRALEATLRDALVLAQKAADETRAAARLQSEAWLQSAQARAQELDLRTQERSHALSGSIERLQQERKRLALDLRARLFAQIAWLDDELKEPASSVPSPDLRETNVAPPGPDGAASFFPADAPAHDNASPLFPADAPAYALVETPPSPPTEREAQ